MSFERTVEWSIMQDYEKLGAFYLGRRADDQQTLLYDSKDLVTHAVCVGMTGSGKTGLCLALLEEAAIDGIPAIVIDPKGDLTNLLLTFPELRPTDFEPWVNEDEARAKGLTVPQFAEQQAELWEKGLAKWDEDGARIQRLRDAAEFAIYTPGSDAGISVSVMKSFAAPPAALRDDREAMRDRVTATATSLLSLAGIDGDPMQSREHVLVAALLDQAWKNGKDVDLAGLIAQIQSPPIAKIGVMDVDSFFAAKDRFALAMQLNNLLASPGFEAWMEGEALEIGNLLYTQKGKPRVAIFSIAHLSDPERMFFVSLLLNQVLSWVRTQSGTTSLRALLYMDEIFGYFPPTANPPSKKPLLTLLKQARAYGLGVVLATQNPVDLDYKGLANTGTWFIGRLQTERDKARVLEGLEGAAAAGGGKFDRGEMERTLAGLGNRVFLMNNVHEDHPVLFETRWCLCYLRGPLSRIQIKQLMSDRKAEPTLKTTKAAADGPPVLPPDIPQYFLPARGEGATSYRPVLLGAAQVHFVDDKKGIDETRDLLFCTPFRADALTVNWADATESLEALEDLEKTAPEEAAFEPLPAAASKKKNLDVWSKDFAAWLFRSQTCDIFRAPDLKIASNVGESERDFRLRLAQTAREERDEQKEKLRQKYAPKVASLEERKRVATQRVEREESQSKDQMVQTAVNIGSTLLGALFGRKTFSTTTIGKAATAARSVGRATRESGDVARAQETVAAIDQQLQNLNTELETELAAIDSSFDPQAVQLETVTIRPKKANISVRLVAIGWQPS